MNGMLAVMAMVLWATMAWGDEAPISGTVKSVDAGARIVIVESTAKGKTRDVVVHVTPGAKIVKFARAVEPGKTGFVEQPLAFIDLKPGWVISVEAKHEDGKEVADVVKVVLER